MTPEGWAETTVDKVCEQVSVGIVVKPADLYVEPSVGVRAFRSANVREGAINDSDWVYISQEGHQQNKKSSLRAGDVLVVRTGYPGTACVTTKEFEGSNCIDIVFARPTPLVNSNFLCAFTNSELGRKQILGRQGGLAQKHLNVGDYKKLKFLLPPIEEQGRIADILSTWDRALRVTEKLIANSQAQKKALIQQLLTGKKRLPGFAQKSLSPHPKLGLVPEDWRVLTVAEIASEVSLRNEGENEYPVLSCSKHAGFVFSLDYFKKQVFSVDTSNYKVIKRHQFGFPTNHVEEGSIGLQNIADCGVVSPIYCVFETQSNMRPAFLFKVLKTDLYRQIFAATTNASVDRRGSLRWSEFSEIPVAVPSLAEQDAIGVALDSAEFGIKNLRKCFDVLRDQKSALMQQLLTGKRRVKLLSSDEEAA